jgi:hypothetical protein
MSGWRTLHATVDQPDDLPTEDEITAFITDRTDRDPTVWVIDDTLFVQVFGRDSGPLHTWAEHHADALGTVAFGRGNDTGPRNDRVTFYTTDGGTLEREGQPRTCPVSRNGLRIESTR